MQNTKTVFEKHGAFLNKNCGVTASCFGWVGALRKGLNGTFGWVFGTQGNEMGSHLVKNILYLLQLIPIQSRFHQEVAKINLLCISFTQRFRGRITSFFCCWKALDLYFECPPKFWSLSATINLNLESEFSILKNFGIFDFFLKIFNFLIFYLKFSKII